MEKLYMSSDLMDEVRTSSSRSTAPTSRAIGAMYPDWFGYGAGVTNYLAVPEMPARHQGHAVRPARAARSSTATWRRVKPIASFQDPYFRDNVTEAIAHAWYDGDWNRHPWEEDTVPKYTEFDRTTASTRGSRRRASRDGRCRWGRWPRCWSAMPPATSSSRSGPTWMLATAAAVAKRKLGPGVLHSTLGRHAARAIRCAAFSELGLKHWGLLVENIGKGDTDDLQPAGSSPKGEQRGFGFHEAPRGTLSHWVVIRDGKIANYQAVVPSTWNAGPRDEKGQKGPYEASLMGNPMADPEKPLEVLRTIHSFDPCLACAIHTVDVEGKEIAPGENVVIPVGEEAASWSLRKPRRGAGPGQRPHGGRCPRPYRDQGARGGVRVSRRGCRCRTSGPPALTSPRTSRASGG